MKKIITSLAICLIGLSNHAQTENSPSKSKYAVGIAAGFTTGYGLSYRYQSTKFGTQITFAPYKNPDKFSLDLGLTFLLKLASYENVELFLYQGNHFSRTTNYTTSNDDSTFDIFNSNTNPQQYFNNGLGLDFEIALNKHAGFHIMAGYAGYKNFRTINITGETALFYKF